jgi:hypothetical protein
MCIFKLKNVAIVTFFLLTLSWGNFVSCEENNVKKHILELGNRLNAILVEEKMCNQATNCLNKDFLFIESIPEGIGVTLYGMQNKATATKKIIKECNEMFFWLNRGVTIHLFAYEATKEQVSQIYSKPYMTLRFDEPTQEKKSEEEQKAEIYGAVLNSIVGAVSDPKNQERFLDYISGGTLYSEEEKLERRKESQKHRHLVKEQRENLSQRLHLIFKEFQECNQPDKCELMSSRNQKKNERIVFVLHSVENPSLIEKVMEECVSTFLNLNGQVNIHLAIRDGATKDEDAIRLAERRPYITLSLKVVK